MLETYSFFEEYLQVNEWTTTVETSKTISAVYVDSIAYSLN